MEVEILSQVRTQYIRNNKSNGQKNIRCFPRCAKTGHRKAGFCGSNLSIQLRVKDDPKFLSLLKFQKTLSNGSQNSSGSEQDNNSEVAYNKVTINFNQ